MEIKIGDKSFRTRKPSDLDGVLISTTGCSAAEAAQHLAGWPTPGRIASALRPFLPDDAPSVPDLAQDIAVADNGPEVLIAVKKLYVDALSATSAPATTGTATA
jgi:hypothetical protein